MRRNAPSYTCCAPCNRFAGRTAVRRRATRHVRTGRRRRPRAAGDGDVWGQAFRRKRCRGLCAWWEHQRVWEWRRGGCGGCGGCERAGVHVDWIICGGMHRMRVQF
eukprot:366527-Chlamydomonas_euryale.AAC.1